MMAIERHRGIWIASIIWLICIAAALIGAALRSGDVSGLVPIAVTASFPAIASLLLTPFLRREWAKITVIFVWIALAVVACLAMAFFPMAILFLCAPAIAALFEKEKVIETMVVAAIAAAAIYYYKQSGLAANIDLSNLSQTDWGTKTGIAATISLLIAALYGVAASKPEPSLDGLSMDILDAVPGGLLRVGADNQISMMTSLAAAQLGLNDEAQNLNASDIFDQGPMRDELLFVIDKSRQSGRKVSRKFRLKQPSGGFRAAEITGGPLKGDEVLLHIHDSSSHESRVNSLHQALATAEKDADGKSLFFAGVSHELRTPLNAIIGFSDMMRSRLFGPLPNKYAEYADLIHDSGQHMLDLIGDVLDLSRVDAGKYELTYHKFDAADVIRSSVKMLRPSADAAQLKLDVEILTETDELLVDADRKALRQVLLNLLSNAVKFTPKGGRVLVRGEAEDGFIKIGVVDNGAGISKDQIALIGQPYSQSDSGRANDARSSGLGLSLVKSLTELHGGRFELSSHEGVGTTAEIIIPVMRA